MASRLRWWVAVCLFAGPVLGLLTLELVPSIAARFVIGMLVGAALALIPIVHQAALGILERPIAALCSAFLALAVLVFDITADRLGFSTLVIAGGVAALVFWANTRD